MRKLKEDDDSEENCCECCIQWSLLVVNVPVMLIGAILIVLSTWTLAERSYIEELQLESGDYHKALVYAMLVAGIVLAALAVFGCVAAFIENRTFVAVYYGSVIVVFVLICVCIVLSFVFRAKAADLLRDELRLTAQNGYDPDDAANPVTKAWDDMQRNLACCGVRSLDGGEESWRVWQRNKRLNSGEADFQVPASCCANNGGRRCDADQEVTLIHSKDCFEEAADFMRGHVEALGAALIGFALILILAAVFAICLFFLAD